MEYNVETFWRFKEGDRKWKVGFPCRVEHHGMVRMALWNGGFGGPVVKVSEIEYRQ